MSRVTQFTNPLGLFNQSYDPVNLMPKTLTAPNGLTTTLDYHSAAADLRLKEIKHTLTGNVALSKHVYGYKPAGNIKSWAQTLGTNPAKTWAIAYDKADQLEAATQTQSGAVTAQQAFRFDRIGNITSRSVGVSPTLSNTQSTHNNRNQIVSEQPGGWMRVRGVTNESSSVRVKSNANPFTPAQTDKDKGFFGWVETIPGPNTLTIEATDDSPNANKKTSSYTVNVTGQSRVPSYDFNGNMTNNGTGQTYLWDAENRLVKITYSDGSNTTFQYDGLSCRTRSTERNASNTITSDKRYVWAGGNQPAEERDATTNAVTKRFFAVGEQRIGGADAGLYYYAKDHLGSIREITNSSGTLAARYDYDLWGKRTKLTGSLDTEVGFTGHHHHAKSGLVLTWYRVYDAELRQWLSADPLGETGGINLYAYCNGDPLNFFDPDGLHPRNFYDDLVDGKPVSDKLIAPYARAIGDSGPEAVDALKTTASTLADILPNPVSPAKKACGIINKCRLAEKSAPIARRLWKIDRYDKVVDAGKFGKVYRDPNTKLWWSKDTAGHGESAWKVFKEEKTGLRWFKDADQYGTYLTGKHKGPVGNGTGLSPVWQGWLSKPSGERCGTMQYQSGTLPPSMPDQNKDRDLMQAGGRSCPQNGRRGATVPAEFTKSGLIPCHSGQLGNLFHGKIRAESELCLKLKNTLN